MIGTLAPAWGTCTRLEAWIGSLGGEGYSSDLSGGEDCSSIGAEGRPPCNSGWSLRQINWKKTFCDPNGWDIYGTNENEKLQPSGLAKKTITESNYMQSWLTFSASWISARDFTWEAIPLGTLGHFCRWFERTWSDFETSLNVFSVRGKNLPLPFPP